MKKRFNPHKVFFSNKQDGLENLSEQEQQQLTGGHGAGDHTEYEWPDQWDEGTAPEQTPISEGESEAPLVQPMGWEDGEDWEDDEEEEDWEDNEDEDWEDEDWEEDEDHDEDEDWEDDDEDEDWEDEEDEDWEDEDWEDDEDIIKLPPIDMPPLEDPEEDPDEDEDDEEEDEDEDEDEDWGYEDEEDDPNVNTDPPHADKQLDRSKLPKDNNTDKQQGTTCVLKVMEWISQYFGGNIDVLTILTYYLNTYDNVTMTDVLFGGIPDPHVNSLATHYFNIVENADIIDSIDEGYPLMGYIEIAPGKGHDVMITGYDIHADPGTDNIQYYDPETGTYDTIDQDSLKNVISITGLK